MHPGALHDHAGGRGVFFAGTVATVVVAVELEPDDELELDDVLEPDDELGLSSFTLMPTAAVGEPVLGSG